MQLQWWFIGLFVFFNQPFCNGHGCWFFLPLRQKIKFNVFLSLHNFYFGFSFSFPEEATTFCPSVERAILSCPPPRYRSTPHTRFKSRMPRCFTYRAFYIFLSMSLFNCPHFRLKPKTRIEGLLNLPLVMDLQEVHFVFVLFFSSPLHSQKDKIAVHLSMLS